MISFPAEIIVFFTEDFMKGDLMIVEEGQSLIVSSYLKVVATHLLE